MGKITVGITMGDPSGIGPEIISKALRKVASIADFMVIGDSKVYKRAGNARLQPGVGFVDLKNVPLDDFAFGKVRPAFGRASIEYLDKALELFRLEQIDCLVTCPISKEAIGLTGFPYPGHTEYLANQLSAGDSVMMLLNRGLKISLVTQHTPLSRVASLLTREKLRKTVVVTYQALQSLFLIRKPRIVVCGLNPHASDNGIIGKEENLIIKPVLQNIRKKGVNVNGPLSADIAIAGAAGGKFDCAVAMYHDQALIPLKLFGNQTGVNITLGLPIVRTSPLHGTAFDIAGKGIASAYSLIEAIRLAVSCTLNKRKRL